MPLDAQLEVPDDTLLVLFANGDRAAARDLTLRLTPRAMALAHRMLGDRAEAEDVTQEAMLKLWKMAPDWEPGRGQVSTWLYRVTSNLCTDRLRSRKGRGPVPLDAVAEPPDDGPGREEALHLQERAAALEDALLTLPERQRQAVILRHLEGLANPEIAEVMDISVEAVESLTARGKRALAAVLARQKTMLGLEE